jgi:hypothetical protein
LGEGGFTVLSNCEMTMNSPLVLLGGYIIIRGGKLLPC